MDMNDTPEVGVRDVLTEDFGKHILLDSIFGYRQVDGFRVIGSDVAILVTFGKYQLVKIVGGHSNNSLPGQFSPQPPFKEFIIYQFSDQ